MSELSESAKPDKKRFIRLLVPIIVILLLLLVYGSGIFILPIAILSSYKGGNCNTVLSLDNFYTTIYPAFIEDKTLTQPAMECAVYSLANRQEGDSDWQEALNSYEVYSASYPNGIFVAKAHEHSALMLVNLAKEQADAKNFSQAVSNLNNVLTKYAGTDAAASAIDLYPEMYISWGVGLRTAGEFEDAQQVFSDFKNWAESNQEPEHAQTAQRELAQTYLDWGLQLQSQKKFEEAESKLDSAESVESTVAEQVRANKEKLHTEWGGFLIDQNDFDKAMEQYGIASKLVEERDPSAAKDVIANGYVQWAGGLVAEKDFIGALVLLDFAQENAATDSAKKSVDEVRSDTYLAFSQSDGEQAQKAMKDAARIVCEHHANPSLPIFGLDEATKRALVYGVETDLPEDLAAKTPGAMHYVACITEDTKIIGREPHLLKNVPLYSNLPPVSFHLYFNRVQFFWTVSLREISTGKEYKVTTIDGGEPPPIDPNSLIDHMNNPYFFGARPDIADLAGWLLQYLK
ncbi:MAG: hypothetical protein IPM31_08635 [Anaerolineae bacterium]|nr:hypothetical protein [Anaerolineae bacterium]MBL8104477.1 hypothetical protein [Anaerolineales bacterium]MCC7188024.1 hypothetical protein [Anaerolineales bacterium]